MNNGTKSSSIFGIGRDVGGSVLAGTKPLIEATGNKGFTEQVNTHSQNQEAIRSTIGRYLASINKVLGGSIAAVQASVQNLAPDGFGLVTVQFTPLDDNGEDISRLTDQPGWRAPSLDIIAQGSAQSPQAALAFQTAVDGNQCAWVLSHRVYGHVASYRLSPSSTINKSNDLPYKLREAARSESLEGAKIYASNKDFIVYTVPFTDATKNNSDLIEGDNYWAAAMYSNDQHQRALRGGVVFRTALPLPANKGQWIVNG